VIADIKERLNDMKESGEMYLETVYVLSKSIDCVRAVDVAKELGVSKPSVSRALKILKDGGFLIVDPNGGISLSDIGSEYAVKIYERHTLLTELFVSFGVDEKTASEDACRIEHVISDISVMKIKNALGKNKSA